MSLLIKALDSAEKTKQAEKNKQQTAENAVPPLALELEPISPFEAKLSVLESSTDLPPTNQTTNPSLPASEPAKPANTLSLEEEAGLSGAALVGNKYSKNKPANSKPASSAAPLKNNLKEAQNAVKTEAAPIPVPATSSFQARPTVVDPNQKAAAKVFVANQAVKPPSSKYALLALGVAGALIIWLGLQGYTYIKPLLTPAVVPAKPATPLQAEVISIETGPAPEAPLATQALLPTEEQLPTSDLANTTNNVEPTAKGAGETVLATNAFSANAGADTRAVSKNLDTRNQINSSNEAGAVSPESVVSMNNATAVREPLKVTTKSPTPGVDPTLLSAYLAFTRGEDSIAQQQYRLVLQKDVRNTDALLGMAAIAQRQGREADAMGWFQKVLEIEPRNSIAQSALINSQTQNDTIGSESRLKSMLAVQPAAAHLHAALGNLYAEQNQWALAQEAYFNASRFAPNNPDYAFNLAVSLDQLGKSDLALKQYQHTLQLLNQTGAASPDRSQVETRIQALQ